MKHDRSSLHHPSEPTVRGGDGTAKAGDVEQQEAVRFGGTLAKVLDHADTNDCKTQVPDASFQKQVSNTCQASSNTELSELQQQAQQGDRLRWYRLNNRCCSEQQCRSK